MFRMTMSQGGGIWVNGHGQFSLVVLLAKSLVRQS